MDEFDDSNVSIKFSSYIDYDAYKALEAEAKKNGRSAREEMNERLRRSLQLPPSKRKVKPNDFFAVVDEDFQLSRFKHLFLLIGKYDRPSFFSLKVRPSPGGRVLELNLFYRTLQLELYDERQWVEE